MNNIEPKMINCPSCGLENPEIAQECEFCGYNLKARSFTSQAEIELLNRALSPKYTIYKKIGRGGMATVFLGDQVELDRKVVVKLLSEEYSEDKDIRERFLQEARTPARIKHPNLVEVIDVGIFEERPYYIMEYAPGGSLSEKLKNYKEQGKTYPLREAIYVISKVLYALDYCHNNRLHSHRDIKPDNIMFRATGEPIITDFGIAKVAGEFRTQTRMTLGTANYMSPEQCRGAKDLDGRSDIYAVGIMLFELLTGDVPFKGESGISVMGKHVNARMPELNLTLKGSTYKTDISSDKLMKKLEMIIKKACAKKREKRFQTAKEFADTLDKLLEENPRLSVPDTNPTESNNVGLIAAMLFLGLGLGSIIAYTFMVKVPNNIVIHTEPPGAKVISLDTPTETGKSPYSIKKEVSGIYKYRISLDGYEEKILEVDLSNVRQPKQISVQLEKKTKEVEEPIEEPVEEPEEKHKNEADKPVPLVVSGLVWQSGGIRMMDWNSAQAYCKRMGMRLPTVDEYSTAYHSKKPVFKKPCCEYWTNSVRETDKEEAYTITVDAFGKYFSHKSNKFYVRCVKK
jgi:serine/threonine protein kinase